jgi:hypothetical protein
MVFHFFRFSKYSLQIQHDLNTALLHEDKDNNCFKPCNFKGLKLMKKINIGVRFTKDMILQVCTLCIEEPSRSLLTKLTQDQELFCQIEYYDAYMVTIKDKTSKVFSFSI